MAATFRLGMVSDANSIEDQNALARVASLAETMARLGHRTHKASLTYQSVVSGRDAEIAAALSELATAESP
jgi:hypothetical protein